jgi:hypothetical protein
MGYSVDAFSKRVFGRLGEIAIVSELPSNPSILWPNGQVVFSFSDNRFYRLSGSGWINVSKLSGLASALGDLTDVTITSPAVDEVLTYNGSEWINVSTAGAFGTGTDGQVLTADGAGSAAWEDLPREVDINAQTGTAYTLVLDDRNKMVTLDNAGAVTMTIPTNAAVAFPVGAVVALAQLGAGVVTVQGDTGVTVNGASAGSFDLSGQYQTAALLQVAADVWVLSGGLAAPT